MPFNLFNSPSSSKSPNGNSSLTFPSPEITYAISASILLRAYNHTLPSVTSDDTQEFLTKYYDSEPSSHWAWIGCTFPRKDIHDALSAHKGIPRAQRKFLQDFVKQQQAGESQRKEQCYQQGGAAAGDAYTAGATKRIEREIKDLEEIMHTRREKLPIKVRYIWTQGHPIVYYEREGDSEDEEQKLRGKKRAK